MAKSEKKDKKKKENVEAEPSVQDVEMANVDAVCVFLSGTLAKF